MDRTLRLGLTGLALALNGCKDLGVRGAANVPLAIARVRPASFWSYQAVTPQTRKAYEGRIGDVFTLGAQQFIVQFRAFSGPTSALVRVGTERGAAVFAPRWARPPFDQVYVEAGSKRLQTATEIWR